MAYRETEKMRTRKAEARSRIIACAQGCVATSGFRACKITQIADCAGVATGTIYRHFQSREDLFAEIFRSASRQEVELVTQALATEGNAVVRLETALRQFAERALRAPVMAWSLIAEPMDPKVESERLAYRRTYARMLEQTIREGIREGSVPEQDARQSSNCLVGAIAESVIGPLSPVLAPGETDPSGEQDHQPLVDAIIHFCMQGLTGIRRLS